MLVGNTINKETNIVNSTETVLEIQWVEADKLAIVKKTWRR